MIKIPSFDFEQIDAFAHDLNRELKGFQLKEFLGLDLSRFIIVFQKETIIKRIFFCLQKPFLRFHFTSHLKSKKHFEHPLNSYLKKAILIEAKTLNQDRILILEFVQHQSKLVLILEFFSKHPNYYLVDASNCILFSLYPIKSMYYIAPSVPIFLSPVSSLLSHEEIEKKYIGYEKEFEFEEIKKKTLASIQHKIKQGLQKQIQLEKELQESLDWEKIYHLGELLKANYTLLKKGLKEIEVWDWLSNQNICINLNPSKLPQDQIKEIFRKSKKLQKGISYIKEQQVKNNQHLVVLNENLNRIKNIQDLDELIIEEKKWLTPLKEQRERNAQVKAAPYRTFISLSGTEIWVGKTAKDNEKLTFSLARGTDWWLHVSGFSGSHVIIKTLKGQEPDNETLLDALQLALHYSQAKRQGASEICVTQQKFVKRFKGQVGKVQISKHKLVFAKIDTERYRFLKERNIQRT